MLALVTSRIGPLQGRVLASGLVTQRDFGATSLGLSACTSRGVCVGDATRRGWCQYRPSQILTIGTKHQTVPESHLTTVGESHKAMLNRVRRTCRKELWMAACVFSTVRVDVEPPVINDRTDTRTTQVAGVQRIRSCHPLHCVPPRLSRLCATRHCKELCTTPRADHQEHVVDIGTGLRLLKRAVCDTTGASSRQRLPPSTPCSGCRKELYTGATSHSKETFATTARCPRCAVDSAHSHVSTGPKKHILNLKKCSRWCAPRPPTCSSLRYKSTRMRVYCESHEVVMMGVTEV